MENRTTLARKSTGVTLKIGNTAGKRCTTPSGYAGSKHLWVSSSTVAFPTLHFQRKDAKGRKESKGDEAGTDFAFVVENGVTAFSGISDLTLLAMPN